MKPIHTTEIRSSALTANFVTDRLAASSRSSTGMGNLWIFTLLVLLATPSAWAQSVRFRAAQVRITVPLNSTDSTVITNLVTVENVATPVNLNVTGLPAGAGYTLSTNGLTTNAPLELTISTTNIAQGEYTFSLNATGGAANNLLFILQAGHLWNGNTNAAVDGASNWSASANWLGGVPGASDDVVFTDLGGQSNSLVAIPGVSTNLLVNSIVDGDRTIASLRFSQTNGATAFHTIQINPGRTLNITGPKGFQFLRDYINEIAGIGQSMTVTITGTGARMVVSNDNANVALTLDGQQANTLDMSRLDNFVADVNRIGLGDYSLYPNFWNLDANQYNGIPRRFIPSVNFARTNVLTASYADPNGYTNADDRLYALTFVNSVYSGTTAIPIWNLGHSNAFLLDGICLVGANQQGRVQFNPTLLVTTNIVPNVSTNFVTNSFVAYFRNTGGGRMSMFAISDDAGTNFSGSNIKSFIDFGSSGGRVDVLADRFYMTRDRKLLSSDGNFQGELYLGKGIIDVNSAILGFQEFTNRSASNTVFRGYCQATMTVSNTAVFRVNGNLELGYGADNNLLGEPFNTRGIINVGPGGTVMASNILFGGITKLSSQSAINLTSGGNLIVSNTIAGPGGKLPSLGIGTGSKLTLHVDGSRTEPYVYVTNLVTSGAGNVLEIASIVNVSTFPAEIALISYESASASLSVTVPPGLFGFLVNDAANKLIKLILSASSPKTVLWRGTASGTADWDTSTLNWVDPVTLAPTNFNQGDFVIFDDTALATNVNVMGALISGQHATIPGASISNVTKNFTFAGNPGDIIAGTGRMLKQGTGTLTVNATSENPLTLSAGTVNGTGSMGLATVAAGGTLAYAGTLAGLTSTGTVSLASAGAINGPVAIFGGSFENSGTVDTRPGGMTIGLGALITNLSSGVLNVFNAWTVTSNAVLANFGRLNNLNNRLNIGPGGLLFGTGVLSRAPGVTADNGRLVIMQGGVFSPGAAPINSIGVFTVEARLDVNQAASGSPAGKLRIEVDLNNPAVNDVVALDKWSNVRGTIVMTNIGAVPFAAGQSFLIASNNFGLANTPEVANLDYTFDPFVPGFGLFWDAFNRFTVGGANFLTNGIVAIKAIPTAATDVLFTTFADTNLAVLAWPADYLGWRLEAQTNTLAVGISTNWANIPNSHLTNQVFIRINRANGAVFYRMVHP